MHRLLRITKNTLKAATYLILVLPLIFGGSAAVYAQVLAEKYLYDYVQDEVKQIIDGEVGGEIILGQMKLVIPAGAFKGEQEISIQQVIKDKHESAESLQNITHGAVIYRFGPHGMHFDLPVQMHMPYQTNANTLRDDEGNRQPVYTYWRNEKKLWQRIEKLHEDEEAGIVISQVDHFSDYINGVLTMPEVAGPLSFNPNSIKDLKAALPTDGVGGLNGLNANNNGIASFSLNIKYPSGRGGLQPEVGIGYSSGGFRSSGSVGSGFNLQASSISIDTKEGAPKYDGTDTYLLDGSELIMYQQMGSDIYYRMRIEGSFQEIIRKTSQSGQYYWQITSKDGMKRLYGQTSESRLQNEQKIYRWHLDQVEDVFGNVATYKYLEDGNNRYLSEVIYSGYNNGNAKIEQGSYKVIYNWQNRNDASVEGRSGWLVHSNLLLKNIQIFYNDQAIRQYQFNYEVNLFGKMQLVSYEEQDGKGEIFFSESFEYQEPFYTENGVVKLFDNATPRPWGKGDMSEDLSLNGGGNGSVGFAINLPSTAKEGTKAKKSDEGKKSDDGKTPFIPKVKVHLGISYNFSVGGSGSWDNAKYIDLTGDGLPDKVRSHGFKLYISKAKEGGGFEAEQELGVKGELGKSRSINHSHGVGLKASAGPVSAHFNSTWGFGSSTTDRIMMDINRDGYIDIVESAGYYLNLKGNGFSNFTPWSSGGIETPSTLTEEEQAELDSQYPYNDTLLMWRTPRQGQIEIVQKIDTQENMGLEVYHNTKKLLSQVIHKESKEDKRILDVNDDDNIYFKVDGQGKRDNTLAYHDINITYKTIALYADLVDYTPLEEKKPFRESNFSALEGKRRELTGIGRGNKKRVSYDAMQNFIEQEMLLINLNRSLSEAQKATQRTQFYDMLNKMYERRRDENNEIYYFLKQALDPTKLWQASVADNYYYYQGTYYPVFSNAGNNYIEVTQITPVKIRDSLLKKIPLEHISYGDSWQEIWYEEKYDEKNNIVFNIITRDHNSKEIILLENQELRNSINIILDGIQHQYQFQYNQETHLNEVKRSFILDANLLVPLERGTYTGNGKDIFPYFEGISTTNDVSYYLEKNYQENRFYPRYVHNFSNVRDFSIDNHMHRNGYLNANGANAIANKNKDKDMDNLSESDGLQITKEMVDLSKNSSNQRYKAEEGFSGGVYLWHYAQWNNKETFSQDKLLADISRNVYEQPKGIIQAMQALSKDGYLFNEDEEEEFLPNQLGEDLWVNSILDYVDSVRNDNGKVENIRKVTFSYLAAGKARPERDGAEQGEQLKQNLGSGDTLLKSKSRSFSMAYGFGASLSKETIGDLEKIGDGIGSTNNSLNLNLGENFSINYSKNEVTKSFMDINGDGYPDLLHISNDRALLVRYGQEGGFLKEEITLHPNIGAISRNKDSSVSIGGNIGGQSGTTTLIYKATKNGNPKIEIDPENSVSSPNYGFDVSAALSDNNQNNNHFKEAEIFLSDLNGDGLPDLVVNEEVFYNLGGKGFSQNGIYLGAIKDLHNSFSISWSASMGSSIGDLGINGSFNHSLGSSRSTRSMMDLNADGLLDIVEKYDSDSNFIVQFNTGKAFTAPVILDKGTWGSLDLVNALLTSYRSSISDANNELDYLNGFNLNSYNQKKLNDKAKTLGISDHPLGIADVIRSGSNYSLGLSGSLSMSPSVFQIPPTISFHIPFSVGLNMSLGYSAAALEMKDIDGDGLVDHVLQHGGSIYYKSNQLGSVGQLKSIKLATGGEVNISYQYHRNGQDMASGSWVMTSVTKSDGQGHHYTTNYQYLGGFYHRGEREQLGFHTVRQVSVRDDKHQDQEIISEQYYKYLDIKELTASENMREDAYYARSIASDTKSYFKNDPKKIISEQHQQIDFKIIAAQKKKSKWLALISSESIEHDPLSSSNVTRKTKNEYRYNEYGDVIEVIDHGDLSRDNEKLIINIVYQPKNRYYQISLPLSITIKDANNKILRQRSASYDAKGNLIQFTNHFDGKSISTNFQYDAYGNLIKMDAPMGYFISVEYDKLLHQFPIKVTDSYGLTSSTSYDFALQVPTKSIDTGGSAFNYSYDSFGRMKELKTSLDASLPALQVIYSPTPYSYTSSQNKPLYSLVTNKVNFEATDHKTIQTLSFVDGLGRLMQSQKESVVDHDGSHHGTLGMVISGAIAYDDLGRVVAAGQPTFRAGAFSTTYTAAQMKNPTQTIFDALGRTSQIILPDGSKSSFSYRLTKHNGQDWLENTIIDAKGNKSISYSDMRGQVGIIQQFNQGKSITTSYSYDRIGQLLKAIDTKGNIVASEYDMRGLRTKLITPDTGITEFFYNDFGQLIKKVDENLRANKEAIEYQYDKMRLSKVLYPRQKPILYEYYNANSSFNSGRLKSVINGDSKSYYEYGALGEMTKLTRELKLHTQPNQPEIWTKPMQMSYKANYLGQLNQITYPDGEVLTYHYDLGGQVNGVSGVRYGQSFNYVNNITYDEFGQRSYIQYGNGVETTYSYDDKMRYLDNLQTIGAGNTTLQNLSYSFDEVGNISQIQNVTSQRNITQSFSYDDLYQLTSASGHYQKSSKAETNIYNQRYVYDDLGNMTSKFSEQKILQTNSKNLDLNYDYTYTYDTRKPHQAIEIGENRYSYDLNGNVIEVMRMMANEISPEDDASLDENNDYQVNVQSLEDGYTSEGAWARDRKNNDSSSSDGTNPSNPNKPQEKKLYTWDEENRLIKAEVGGDVVHFKYDASGQRTTKKSAQKEHIYYDKMWQVNVTRNGNIEFKNIYLGKDRLLTKFGNESKHDATDNSYQKLNQYYNHANHIGSVNVITDSQGREFKYVEYAPYGEQWISETATLAGSGAVGPDAIEFGFTDHLHDEETGLIYANARYLDPKTSRWMSADPAMGEYFPEASSNEGAAERNQNLPGLGGLYNSRNLQTYHYAGNNPLKYTDPTGEAAVLAYIILVGVIFLLASDSPQGPPLSKNNHPYLALSGLGFGHEGVDKFLEAGKINLPYGFYFDINVFLGGLFKEADKDPSSMSTDDYINFFEETLKTKENLSSNEKKLLLELLNLLKEEEKSKLEDQQRTVNNLQNQLDKEREKLKKIEQDLDKINNLEKQLGENN